MRGLRSVLLVVAAALSASGCLAEQRDITPERAGHVDPEDAQCELVETLRDGRVLESHSVRGPVTGAVTGL